MTLLLYAPVPVQAGDREVVVLLHGIGHSRWNMYWVERALIKEGYDVVNMTYPSLTQDIAGLSQWIDTRLSEENLWKDSRKVHFVTHSMGGLVLRHYLEDQEPHIPKDRLGRVVMLAPPHGGSEIADLLKDFPPYQWSFGPAGKELTTAARKKSNLKPYYELGIIAGSKSWPYFAAGYFMNGEHDGRVSVASTKINGMQDHIVLPATHSFIAWKPSVHDQIVNFIRNGKFEHEE